MFKGRNWINIIFCISLATAGVILFYVNRKERIDLLISLSSLIIAIFSLWVHIFFRYIQKAKISGFINHIIAFDMPEINKINFIRKVYVEDFMAKTPSVEAKHAISQSPQIREFVEMKDRVGLSSFFDKNYPQNYGYSISKDLILKYIDDIVCTPPFYLPLILHNSGGRTGHISSIWMTMKRMDVQEESSKIWLFNAFCLIDSNRILDRRKQAVDVDIFSEFFTGCSISPQETKRLDLYFSLIHKTTEVYISDSNLTKGTYLVKVFCFDEENKEVMKAEVFYPIGEEILIGSYYGIKSQYSPSFDKNIKYLFDKYR